MSRIKIKKKKKKDMSCEYKQTQLYCFVCLKRIEPGQVGRQRGNRVKKTILRCVSP